MYSFSRTAGCYEGRPVASGATPSNPTLDKSSLSTKASITRTGLSSSIQSSRHSGNSVAWPRSIPSTKRLIRSLRKCVGIIQRESNNQMRFHTVTVRVGHSTVFAQCPNCPPKRKSIRALAMSQKCHNVWPGRAVQDGLPRSANVRAASMYQASEVEHLLLAIMGYPRASGTRYRTDLEGPLWHPVSWLRRADRSSISSFHLADSAGKLFELIILVSEPLRQRSRIVSHCMRRDPRLIFPTA